VPLQLLPVAETKHMSSWRLGKGETWSILSLGTGWLSYLVGRISGTVAL
jgi:hypothetical protein